jgi:hypothetical protein
MTTRVQTGRLELAMVGLNAGLEQYRRTCYAAFALGGAACST